MFARLRRLWSGSSNIKPPQMARTDYYRDLVPLGLVPGLTLMPWIDEQTEETAEVKQAYRGMLKDPVVESQLEQILFAVASLDLTMQPGAESDRAAEKAAFAIQALQRVKGGLPGLSVKLGLHGFVDGDVIAEKKMGVETRGRFRGKRRFLELKPRDDCRLVQDEYGNSIGVFSHVTQETYALDKFIIWQRMPLFSGPGRSKFRSAYRAYWVKKTAIEIWLNGLEKDVEGMLKGEYDPNDNTGTLTADAMEKALQNARGSTYIVVPKGAVVEALNLSKRMNSDFQAACEYMDKQITVGISGAVLQSLDGGAVGSFAKAKVHMTTADLPKWMWASDFCQILNEQAVPHLIKENYIDDGEDYPTLTSGAVDVDELIKEAQLDGLLQDQGLGLSADAAYKKYNRVRPKSPDDALKPAAAPAPMGAPLPFTEDKPPGGMVPFAAAESSGQPAPQDKTMALAGEDGRQAEKFIANCKQAGIDVLADICRSAFTRLADNHQDAKQLFNDAERGRLAAALAATNATGYLLGASRIRLRERRALDLKGTTQFSDEATVWTFETGNTKVEVRPVPPIEALDFFKKLVPSLSVEPARFGPLMERNAFTLAYNTEQTLLEKVQAIVATTLESGKGIRHAPAFIDEALDRAGVSPSNPQYSEMVLRTNAMDSYNTGGQRELTAAKGTFPAWRYANARLPASRKTHRDRHGKYWSADVLFTDVRGTDAEDVCNCTCTFIPIDRWEWEDLRGKGAHLEAA